MPEVKSRRAQYSEATRAALLETATQMFAERGFAGTALADVAATAQVTRGAVYHHFENKEALFRSVFEVLEADMAERSRAAYENADDPLQGSFASMNAFLDRSCDPVYGEIVWRQGPIAFGWSEWKQCEEEFALGLIADILRDLVDSGRTGPIPVETTARLAFSLLGGAGMALVDAEESDKPQVKAECIQVMGWFIAGLLHAEA
ncbi:MAG: TetR family transcriptional regulator [Nocardioidaceae bacterium]